MALLNHTDNNDILYDALMRIYDRFIDSKRFVRNVGFAFGKLKALDCEQLDLFCDPFEQDRQRKLQRTLDEIKYRYGKNAIFRATALLKSSTTIERHNLIGGHRR
jgi:DNA polymerase V